MAQKASSYPNLICSDSPELLSLASETAGRHCLFSGFDRFPVQATSFLLASGNAIGIYVNSPHFSHEKTIYYSGFVENRKIMLASLDIS
jgi:hypothetical protein